MLTCKIKIHKGGKLRRRRNINKCKIKTSSQDLFFLFPQIRIVTIAAAVYLFLLHLNFHFPSTKQALTDIHSQKTKRFNSNSKFYFNCHFHYFILLLLLLFIISFLSMASMITTWCSEN